MQRTRAGSPRVPRIRGREECRTLSQEGFSSPAVDDAQDKLDQTGEWGGQRWGEGGPKLRDTPGTRSKHMDQQTRDALPFKAWRWRGLARWR